MIEAKSTDAIALQTIWKRTHMGRIIREDALKVMAQEIDESRGICECPNCGFVFGEEWFINGCPNCNSTEGINKGE
jgi:Zn finger protein HypA/HybF involved in hydrogenase expression